MVRLAVEVTVPLSFPPPSPIPLPLFATSFPQTSTSPYFNDREVAGILHFPDSSGRETARCFKTIKLLIAAAEVHCKLIRLESCCATVDERSCFTIRGEKARECNEKR